MKVYMTALTSIFVLIITLNSAYAGSAGSPKCKRIEQKIAKAESLAEFAKYNMRGAQGANAMIGARKRAERHRQEYHDMGCDGSMPTIQPMEQQAMQPPATQPSPADIKEACMKQCRQYTERSDAECFDACWK